MVDIGRVPVLPDIRIGCHAGAQSVRWHRRWCDGSRHHYDSERGRAADRARVDRVFRRRISIKAQQSAIHASHPFVGRLRLRALFFAIGWRFDHRDHADRLDSERSALVEDISTAIAPDEVDRRSQLRDLHVPCPDLHYDSEYGPGLRPAGQAMGIGSGGDEYRYDRWYRPYIVRKTGASGAELSEANAMAAPRWNDGRSRSQSRIGELTKLIAICPPVLNAAELLVAGAFSTPCRAPPRQRDHPPRRTQRPRRGRGTAEPAPPQPRRAHLPQPPLRPPLRHDAPDQRERRRRRPVGPGGKSVII